ncbi:protein LKAAEAR1-like isoform X2 [Physella acuta]|uniref:protein LKAAEAR1-like isoform X2 n=1 Tax=Physella acuta TaxID=109671 RepID=UPI0027DD74B7|nr:protein LKAAEAR1-like isoform X2 [Physella acuta]
MSENKRQPLRKQLPLEELQKLPPQLKSRYMAYQEPPKEVMDAQAISKKRLLERKQKLNTAAEARNRLRVMRLRYQANRAQEISHLIACQPVALKAVRLQALVPPHAEIKEKGDLLDKFSRQRVEALLKDVHGLLTNRVN